MLLAYPKFEGGLISFSIGSQIWSIIEEFKCVSHNMCHTWCAPIHTWCSSCLLCDRIWCYLSPPAGVCDLLLLFCAKFLIWSIPSPLLVCVIVVSSHYWCVSYVLIWSVSFPCLISWLLVCSLCCLPISYSHFGYFDLTIGFRGCWLVATCC